MSTFKIASTDYIDDNFAAKADLGTKQDKLTAGENITIENNVISAQGGGGGGTWYEPGYSKVYIGPNYGDTPDGQLVLGDKNGSHMIEMTWEYMSLQSQHVIHLSARTAVFIGPETGGVKVYSDGETHFESSVYDKNNNEILGGGSTPFYHNNNDSEVWIGPDENNTYLRHFVVKSGTYGNELEYIKAGDGNLNLFAGSDVYIGPNTRNNNNKANNVNIDVTNAITLTVDDLSLQLDKTKLQKLIDLLNQ